MSAALDLRERVFAVEQGVDPAADRDGRDHEALHLVAMDGDQVIGTCRLVFNGLARAPGPTGGAALAAPARGWAQRCSPRPTARPATAGATSIDLHAQMPARELYLRDGYSERGDVFVEEGIEHVAMDKRLA